jgi:uncharacterized cupin superfamily protein
MKKIDISAAPTRTGSRYPAPFHASGMDKVRRQLGLAGGLTQFGVNLLTLKPGVWSSQRHWHTREDEFVYELEGEVTLDTDAGEEVLHAGDCAAFKAGDPDGHHLINRSGRNAVVLEIGSSLTGDEVDYPDIDLRATDAGYSHKDGAPYPSDQ